MSTGTDVRRQITLGALCREGGGGIQTGPFGSQLHAADYVSVGVPSVMPQNIGDNIINEGGIARITEADAERLQRYRLSEGDIVYSRRGDVEKRALVRAEHEGWLCGTGCLRVRLGDPSINDPRFISYLLGVPETREWISQHAIGATMPNLNTGILSNVPLSVPSIGEQRAIAEVLGALDDKIAANARTNSSINTYLSSLHEHSIASTAISPRPLLDVVSVEFGEPFKGDEFVGPETGRPLIRIRDLKTFSSRIWTTETRVREVVVQTGDIVVGMDAEFRATTWLGRPGLLNQRVCRMKGLIFGNAFLRESLRVPLMAMENSKSATTVIHLNKSDLVRMTVKVPPAQELEMFEVLAQPVFDLQIALAIENRTLAATRDALLPQLMSGKLRVKDAADVLEGVL